MTFLQDLRIALRQLGRRPGFTTTAVLTLAIGMGVNAVAFSVVNGLLIKGFATRVVPGVGRIAMTPGGDEEGNASVAEYERFADATKAAIDLAAEGRSSVAWRHDGVTETAYVLYVSANYFSLVNGELLAGRLQVARGVDGPPSVVIGERFWRERLGSPALAGLTLRLRGTDVAVAGIVRESFTGPAGLYSPDAWLPLEDLALFSASPALATRETRWLFLMGRLHPGATTAQVQGLVDAAVTSMAREWPDTHKDRGGRFRMLGEGNSELRAVTIAASIAMGIIGLILLLACFNVANLLLARAVERERDMGIRTALGARPAQLMRLVLIEGVVLAGLSGALALVLAWWTQALVGTFAIPIDVPQHIDLEPDAMLLAFIAVLVCVAGVLPGLWPAVAAARVNVSRVLGSQGANAAGGRPSPLRRWLVGAQIAGSTAFLAIALLFLQSYGRLATVDVGFARGHLVVTDVEPAAHGLSGDRARQYVEAFSDRIRALPGVVDVAVAERAPFFIGFARRMALWPAGGPCEGDACPNVPANSVGPGYFRTMGIAIARGREAAGAGEVVINQALAQSQWPDGRDIGETIRVGAGGTPLLVVGVTGKMQTIGLDRERPTLFLALGPEHFETSLSLIARTAGAPTPLVPLVAGAARSVDPDVPLISVKTMEQRMAVQLWPFRTLSWLFSICGSLALVLATVGLTGVVMHAVSRRMREFGVRVSIGATRSDLIAEVLRGGTRLLVPGLLAGLLLARGAARFAQALFVGVNVLNPLVYLAVALTQCAIVTAACVWPAMRASRVDPLVALRAD